MNYFTRALATHCSDIVKTQADKLLTRINAVIKIYNKLEGYGELVTELSENRIKLVRLGEKNIVTIDAVRNGLFAHRDGKGIAQNNAIDSIDTAAIATIADEIDKTLWAMMGGLIKIQQVLSPMLPTLVNGSWK